MATQIKTITGHLTAREKSAIAHMIEHGMTDAKTARLTFSLALGEFAGSHEVTITRTERDDWGRPYIRRDRATFATQQTA